MSDIEGSDPNDIVSSDEEVDNNSDNNNSDNEERQNHNLKDANDESDDEDEDNDEKEDEEDDDEEDDEDDDDDETSGIKRTLHGKSRSKKAKKIEKNPLMEDEAEVSQSGDTEEELESEDGFTEENNEILDKELNKTRVNRHIYTELPLDNPDKVEEDVNRRYNQADETEFVNLGHGSMTDTRRPPTVKDPKLFIVQVKIGCEYQAVLSLMNKFRSFELFSLRHPDERRFLNIYSCAATEVPGYIYIEADNESFVRQAVQDLTIFNTMGRYGIRRIDREQMISVFEIQQVHKPVYKDEWIRINTGMYKGDLGKVYSVSDHSEKAIIQMIPRIDKYELREVAAKRGKKRNYTPTNRPKPLFFNIKDYPGVNYTEEHHKDVMDSDDIFIKFNNDYYKDGYIFKSFSIKQLVQGITPEPDELNFFNKDTSSDIIVNEPETVNIMKELHIFTPGDKVRVISGSLIHLEGTVKLYDNRKDVVLVQPSIGNISEVELKEDELEKIFNVGDHIKILSGPHRSKTGVIISVEEPDDEDTNKYHYAIILTDSDMKDIKTPMNNLVITTEYSQGITSQGGYNLYDMVNLYNRHVGMIVALNPNQVNILNPNNKESSYSYKELRGKLRRNEMNAQINDKHQERLFVKNTVKIEEGQFKNYIGTIRCIWKSYVYIHCNDVLEHAGIVVCKNRQVSLQGKRDPSSDFLVVGNKSKNQNVGKFVNIIGGTYKGLTGQIRETKGNQIIVQLMNRKAFVSIDASYIRYRDEENNIGTVLPSFSSYTTSSAVSSDFNNSLSLLGQDTYAVPDGMWSTNDLYTTEPSSSLVSTPQNLISNPQHDYTNPSNTSSITNTNNNSLNFNENDLYSHVQTSNDDNHLYARDDMNNDLEQHVSHQESEEHDINDEDHNYKYDYNKDNENDMDNDIDDEFYSSYEWVMPGCIITTIINGISECATIISNNADKKTMEIILDSDQSQHIINYDEGTPYKPMEADQQVIIAFYGSQDRMKGTIITIENGIYYAHFKDDDVNLDATEEVRNFICINQQYYKEQK